MPPGPVRVGSSCERTPEGSGATTNTSAPTTGLPACIDDDAVEPVAGESFRSGQVWSALTSRLGNSLR